MSPVTTSTCLEVSNRKPSLEGIPKFHGVTRTQVLPVALPLCPQAGCILRRLLHGCATAEPQSSLQASSLHPAGQREPRPQLDPKTMVPLGLGECLLLVDAGLGSWSQWDGTGLPGAEGGVHPSQTQRPGYELGRGDPELATELTAQLSPLLHIKAT